MTAGIVEYHILISRNGKNYSRCYSLESNLHPPGPKKTDYFLHLLHKHCALRNLRRCSVETRQEDGHAGTDPHAAGG